MAEFSASGERFDMGRVLTRTFSSILENWMVLGGFALIGGVATAALTGASMSTMLQNFDPANPQAVLAIFATPPYWVALFGGIFVTAFVQSGLIAGLLSEHASFSDCASNAARNFLPLLCVTILWYLGVALGWIFLVIPGIMLITMWSVALPALVADNTGITGAFGRSRALTKGLRWPVFGTLLIFLIVISIVSFAAQGFSSTGMLRLFQTNFAIGMGMALVSNTIGSLLITSFLVSLYKELRTTKEGTGQSGLAEIFS